MSSRLTCTLCPADERRPRSPCAALPRPGEQDTDAVLRVWLQMPHFVGERPNAVGLGQHGMAGAVLDFPPDDRSVPHDGVGVELDDEIRGARAHELRRRDRSRRNCGTNVDCENEAFLKAQQKDTAAPSKRLLAKDQSKSKVLNHFRWEGRERGSFVTDFYISFCSVTPIVLFLLRHSIELKKEKN